MDDVGSIEFYEVVTTGGKGPLTSRDQRKTLLSGRNTCGKRTTARRWVRTLGWVLVALSIVHWATVFVDSAQPLPASSSFLTYGGTDGAPSAPDQIGQLFVNFLRPDGAVEQRTCTATALSTAKNGEAGNGSVLLTAAHCLDPDPGEQLQGARFYPGLHVHAVDADRIVHPAGGWTVGAFVSGWTNGDERSPRDDIAFAVVCPRSGGETISSIVGGMAIDANIALPGLWTSVGYPRIGDDPNDVHRPVVIHSEAVRGGNRILGYDDAIVRLNATDDMVAGGMSGAPVIANYEPATSDTDSGRNRIAYVITSMSGSGDDGSGSAHYIARLIDDRAWSDYSLARSVTPGVANPGLVDVDDCSSEPAAKASGLEKLPTKRHLIGD